MKIKMLLIGLFLVGFTFAVEAQTPTPKVTKRQVKQQARIGHGVKKGELTKGEVARLQKQQQRINKSKKHAKSDGKVTKKERAVLHKRQNAANRNIKRKKNNKVSRN